MATNIENLLIAVRSNLNEQKKSRYRRFTTTSAGASDGTTAICASLNDLNNDALNGCEMLVLSSGVLENKKRVVEDFVSSTGTLHFTNNAFEAQVPTSTVCEVFEKGIWSSADIKLKLIDAINFLAGALPKAALNGYVRKEAVGSVGGVADCPTNAIDLLSVYINDEPAVPVPPERMARLISGRDRYANPTTTNRYMYLFEGKNTTQAQLRFFPATNVGVTYNKIPLMTDFESDGSTYFPDEFFQAASLYATGLLYQVNRDLEFANVFFSRAFENLQSRGIKITKFVQAD